MAVHVNRGTVGSDLPNVRGTRDRSRILFINFREQATAEDCTSRSP
jgi:hypothetical protein